MAQKSGQLLVQVQTRGPPRLLLLPRLYWYVPGHTAVIALQDALQLLHGLAALYAQPAAVSPWAQSDTAAALAAMLPVLEYAGEDYGVSGDA